jgi:hypothetical protein
MNSFLFCFLVAARIEGLEYRQLWGWKKRRKGMGRRRVARHTASSSYIRSSQLCGITHGRTGWCLNIVLFSGLGLALCPLLLEFRPGFRKQDGCCSSLAAGAEAAHPPCPPSSWQWRVGPGPLGGESVSTWLGMQSGEEKDPLAEPPAVTPACCSGGLCAVPRFPGDGASFSRLLKKGAG